MVKFFSKLTTIEFVITIFSTVIKNVKRPAEEFTDSKFPFKSRAALSFGFELSHSF